MALPRFKSALRRMLLDVAGASVFVFNYSTHGLADDTRKYWYRLRNRNKHILTWFSNILHKFNEKRKEKKLLIYGPFIFFSKILGIVKKQYYCRKSLLLVIYCRFKIDDIT